MGANLPTGTVTFLFSDIEGSTRLWEEHPEEMKTALTAHDVIMRSAIADSGGHVFSTAGDSYSAAFGRPSMAIEATLRAQTGLADIAVADTPMKVRMAVHTGSADERGGDYFGPTVNRAARLMSIGNGRQVLVSAVTAGMAQEDLPTGATLDDVGEHRLKDLSRPERVYQLLHESIPADTRPLRSLDAFPHNLPIQLTSFVGREDEIEEVSKLLRGSRMVTLAGVGGAGKTRLATQTAAEVLSNYEDGVWLIELAAITDPIRIPATVMDVLGIEQKANKDPIDTITRALSRKQTLLVLDNCEHIIDSAARFASAALGAGSGVSILATSREMLGVPGECPFQVRSLASPESLDDEVRAALLRYAAVRLFSERGELAKPGWRLSSSNAASVVQICRRLDGMPLAIELAAARLRMMGSSQIAERLDDRFRLLTGGSRTVLPRQQTLEAAMDWSYDLLSEEEKALFGRLAVFMGGFTLESAEGVCGVDPLERYAVLDLLGHLVDKSLVQAEERDDGVRYRMLETLRQYARQRLAESEDVGDMRRRHAEHFRTLVERAEPDIPGADEAYWIRRLDDELDNIRQAIGWALEAPEPQLAQAISGSLYRYFMLRYRFVEGREWAEKAVEASADPTAERAKALLAAGTLAQFSLDQDVAMKHLDQAIDLTRALGLDHDLSAALNNRANVSSGMGMDDEAERLYKEHLELARRKDDSNGIVIGLINLGSIALGRGDHESAMRLYEEAEQEAKELGSDRLIFMSRISMPEALQAKGDLDGLEAILDEIETQSADYAPGFATAWRAILYLDQGDLQAAVRKMVESMRRFRGIPNPYEFTWPLQWTLWQGARLLIHLGNPHVATRILGASDLILEEKGYWRGGYEQRCAEEVADAAKAGLGDDNYDFAYAAGKETDARDAHDLLLATLEEVTG